MLRIGNKGSYSIFPKHFHLASVTHSHFTRSARNCLLFIQSYNCQIRRKINYPLTTLTWNHLQGKFNEYDFFCPLPKSLTVLPIKCFIST